MTDGRKSVFPVWDNTSNNSIPTSGLIKRELFAAMILAGIASSGGMTDTLSNREIAAEAVELADALVKVLSEGEQ